MKKQAFVLTLGVVLLSVMVATGMLISAQAHKESPVGDSDFAIWAGFGNGENLVNGTGLRKGSLSAQGAGSANGAVGGYGGGEWVQGEQTQAGEYKLS
ncbi:MAG TPA: hypothetical protein VMS31_20995, partial [Pyrinomonadaceae bacterium]|nr:hypothetical protein [Pyrinomonadaceae bacterium]